MTDLACEIRTYEVMSLVNTQEPHMNHRQTTCVKHVKTVENHM